ncbi:hypothetical protein P3W85_21600 [Cupriavidus basilensis]|uniref:Lipoprotein n=1 Tax=Cupriavidus basilensis TaxID=68895 RepID=A0ABT6AUY1_9BURK|nr:hypothetical protein [Cupriavidus basilensis]MDF3835526.1 hypothetical protein [Cupriavidus basilensis]
MNTFYKLLPILLASCQFSYPIEFNDSAQAYTPRLRQRDAPPSGTDFSGLGVEREGNEKAAIADDVRRVHSLPVLDAYAYVQLPKFAKLPDSSRLDAIENSPNYADGAFKNLTPTPMLTGDSSFAHVLLSNVFS